jgi:predicted phosphodiesterase
MRVAALYDIHGNLPALEAVLAEPDGLAADLVVVGGDALAGPMPAETLGLLVALGDRVAWVRGNTEREVIERCDADPADGELWDRARRGSPGG